MTVRSRLTSAALGYLGLTSLFVGLWAQGLPRAFYDHFPGVGIWVAGDGPYNEHLVRDVGGLNLSLAVVVWLAWRQPAQFPLSGIGWAVLVYGVPHLLYHAAHLHTLASVADRFSSMSGLLASVLCALVLLLKPLPGVRQMT